MLQSGLNLGTPSSTLTPQQLAAQTQAIQVSFCCQTISLLVCQVINQPNSSPLLLLPGPIGSVPEWIVPNVGSLRIVVRARSARKEAEPSRYPCLVLRFTELTTPVCLCQMLAIC